MATTIFIKSTLGWSGEPKFYVGLEPSDPKRGLGNRLGSYFICTDFVDTARAIARSEAVRIGAPIVECPTLVDF